MFLYADSNGYYDAGKSRLPSNCSDGPLKPGKSASRPAANYPTMYPEANAARGPVGRFVETDLKASFRGRTRSNFMVMVHDQALAATEQRVCKNNPHPRRSCQYFAWSRKAEEPAGYQTRLRPGQTPIRLTTGLLTTKLKRRIPLTKSRKNNDRCEECLLVLPYLSEPYARWLL